MLFNSYVFLFVFLPVTLLAWWLVRSPASVRLAILTAASFVFYSFWDWRFSMLMLVTISIDYLVGKQISMHGRESIRRLWLSFSLVINLGLLGFFKYADMILGTTVQLSDLLGLELGLVTLGVVLPIGISFYTFQSISYSIDIFRGQAKPAPSFLHFAAYVSMFPQLVAGPIIRYRDIDEQLRSLPVRPDYDLWFRGIVLFVIGMCKKLFLADLLGSRVDSLLGDPKSLQFVGSWISMIGYSLQIYFDFSGYSDMAVGLGGMLGFRFPQNFNSPYKAVSPSDFWRRWHMTLSQWLRDNLYIPLGGGRGSLARVLRNVILTMFLGGLWHGAQWTFVVWGLYHGLLLAGQRLLVGMGLRAAKWQGRLTTYLLVVVGWVFFRADSFEMSRDVLLAMFGFRGVESVGGWPEEDLVGIVAVGLGVGLFGPNSWEIRFEPKLRWALAMAGLMFLCVLRLGRQSPFLYFQF